MKKQENRSRQVTFPWTWPPMSLLRFLPHFKHPVLCPHFHRHASREWRFLPAMPPLSPPSAMAWWANGAEQTVLPLLGMAIVKTRRRETRDANVQTLRWHYVASPPSRRGLSCLDVTGRNNPCGITKLLGIGRT